MITRLYPIATFRIPQCRSYAASAGSDGESSTPSEEDSGALEVVEGSDSGHMSTINIPDVFPIVPLLAINRYPLFPGFIKKVDIVKDDGLKQVIRNRIALKQPYVGVFVKQDDESVIGITI